MLKFYTPLLAKQPGKNTGIMDLPFPEQVEKDSEMLKTLLNNQLLAKTEYREWIQAQRGDIAKHLTKPNKDDIFHVKTTPCVNCGGPGHPKFRCEYCGT